MTEKQHIDVAYVAHLARLELTQEEVATLQPQLEEIVAYVQQLQELETDGVEPTAHAVDVVNVLRDDVPRGEAEEVEREMLLDNAPARIGDLISVPKILE